MISFLFSFITHHSAFIPQLNWLAEYRMQIEILHAIQLSDTEWVETK